MLSRKHFAGLVVAAAALCPVLVLLVMAEVSAGERLRVLSDEELVFAAVLFRSHLGQTRQRLSVTTTRQDLIARLKHQHSLVRSASFEYSVRFEPTREEIVPLIQKVCDRVGDRADRFILDDHKAQAMSYSERYWRLGVKERAERFPFRQIGKEEPRSLLASDGQFLRDVSMASDKVFGTFESSGSAARYRSDELHPFAFLYEFMYDPYWKILTRASSCEIQRVADRMNVSFNDPERKGFAFKLVFDKHQRLVQRDVFAPGYGTTAKDVGLYTRWKIEDYQPYSDESGELIWFPQQAVVHYYMNELLDGTPVAYWSTTVNIDNAAFNLDIDDEHFELEFPDNAQVWDGVTGRGWIRGRAVIESDAPELLDNRIWLIVGNVTVLVLLALFAVIVRYRKRDRGVVKD